jgi:hypothetical protein
MHKNERRWSSSGSSSRIEGKGKIRHPIAFHQSIQEYLSVQKDHYAVPGAVEVGENSNSTINSYTESESESLSPWASPMQSPEPSKIAMNHGPLIPPTRRGSIEESSCRVMVDKEEGVIDDGTIPPKNDDIVCITRPNHTLSMPSKARRKFPPNLGPLTKPLRKSSDETQCKNCNVKSSSLSLSNPQPIRLNSGIDHITRNYNPSKYSKQLRTMNGGVLEIKVQQQQEEDEEKEQHSRVHDNGDDHDASSSSTDMSTLSKIASRVDRILDEMYTFSSDSSSSNHTSSSSASSSPCAIHVPVQPVRQESLDYDGCR